MKIKSIIIFGLVAFVFMASLGCKDKHLQSERTVNTVTVYKEIVRDSIHFTPADSSSFIALLACDSLNNVYIKEITELQGDRSSISLTAIPVNTGFQLTAKCKCDSIKIYLAMKDRYYFKKIESKEILKSVKKGKTVFAFIKAFCLGTGAGIIFTILSILLIKLVRRFYGLKK